MSQPTNVRKTYMMLSESNAEKFVTDPQGNVIMVHPTEYVSRFVTKNSAGVGQPIVTTTTSQRVPIFTYRFPPEFINSKNPRSIEVHHVKMLYQNRETKDIILHSNIIQRDPYLDHSVMVVNETRTKYKKYAYTQNEQTFTIWFTSFSKPNTNINLNEISFMVEMMLIY